MAHIPTMFESQMGSREMTLGGRRTSTIGARRDSVGGRRNSIAGRRNSCTPGGAGDCVAGGAQPTALQARTQGVHPEPGRANRPPPWNRDLLLLLACS